MNQSCQCFVRLMAIPALLSACAFAEGFDGDALAKRVEISRDTYGVPHILAETEEAAIFAYGYTVAEDRILALARLFLQARSEEAAYFGQRFAENDLMTKKLHVYDVAAEGYAKTAPWYQHILDAYAEGYNRYIAQHRDDLPEWVKPVTGIDVLAHARRVIVVEFDMNLRQVRALGRSNSAEAGFEPDTDEMPIGSNMWAINRERSESGNALLLGNPHLGWSGSHLWHEVHLTIPGKLDYMGAALIGFPHPALGFNAQLGWSHTVNSHDSDDVYELQLDPDDPHRYLYEGRSVAMTKDVNTIVVTTEGGPREVSEDVYWTHYGPVVKADEGKAYAYKTASMGEYRLLEQWFLMMKAGSLNEFRAVLDMQALPMFNVCYADVDGNCFYLFNGRFPDRPEGYDWSGVVPGGTADTEWNRVLPQRRLPSLLNPPGGYVQNSNSAPWYTNLNAIIDSTAYPEDLTPDFNGFRTQLSLQLLESDKSISLDEMLKYKFDTTLLLAKRVKDDLVAMTRGKSFNGVDLAPAVNILEKWDATASPESVGSVLFVAFWSRYRGQAKPTYVVEWNAQEPASTPRGLGDGNAVVKALAEAMDDTKRKYGRIDVPWGDVYRLRRGDVDVPIGGYTDTLGAFRVVNYTPAKDNVNVASGGDSYVFAVEFAKPLKAYSVLAYSQSDDPASKHFADQSSLFAQGQWKRAWFDASEIKTNTEKTYRP